MPRRQNGKDAKPRVHYMHYTTVHDDILKSNASHTQRLKSRDPDNAPRKRACCEMQSKNEYICPYSTKKKEEKNIKDEKFMKLTYETEYIMSFINDK